MWVKFVWERWPYLLLFAPTKTKDPRGAGSLQGHLLVVLPRQMWDPTKQPAQNTPFLAPGRGMGHQPKLRDSQLPVCGVSAETERDVAFLGAQSTTGTEEEGGMMLLR